MKPIKLKWWRKKYIFSDNDIQKKITELNQS